MAESGAESGVDMMTFPPLAAGGLHHGIYRNEAVPKAIAKYVAERKSALTSRALS